jgi:MoaA/NifB/PqqE/SkfB family radical SAM enzyme
MAQLAYIQVTRTCNQNCRFCSNPSTGAVISLARARRLIDKYVRDGQDGLILSGGEPTTHPELESIISYAAGKKFSVRIITNGQKTADIKYLRALKDSGLMHIGVSLYSDDAKVHDFLADTKGSLSNALKTLDNAAKLGLNTNIHTVINHYNAGHLGRLAAMLIKRYPEIKHFVYNNLDPNMNRAAENPDTVPKLWEFEVELYKALKLLSSAGRTFRVERVPLCYMADFAWASTETRKIVKKEGRTIYFLSEDGLTHQPPEGWRHSKHKRCKECSLDRICAGLYAMGKYYDGEELSPLFIPAETIKARILGGEA